MKNGLTSIIALMALAACGGGKGGGDGDPAPLQAPQIPFSNGATTPVSGANNVMQSGVDSARFPVKVGPGSLSTSSSSLSAYSLTRTANELTLSNSPVHSVDFNFASDFVAGNNFIFASKSTAEGSGSYNDTVVLGGQKLGLEYADFGVWKSSYARYNSNSVPEFVRNADVPFFVANTSRESARPAANQIFTGTAVGSAYDYTGGNNNVKDISGAATLNFNSSTNRMEMTLAFDNFYTFTFTPNITVGTNGSYGAGSYSSTSVAVSGNAGGTGISFANGTYMANVVGQFYGASAGAPSETAGTFMLNSGASLGGSVKGIIGAFGARQP